jgi:hypothetical protein
VVTRLDMGSSGPCPRRFEPSRPRAFPPQYMVKGTVPATKVNFCRKQCLDQVTCRSAGRPASVLLQLRNSCERRPNTTSYAVTGRSSPLLHAAQPPNFSTGMCMSALGSHAAPTRLQDATVHVNVVTNDSKATVSVLYWYGNYPTH